LYHVPDIITVFLGLELNPLWAIKTAEQRTNTQQYSDL